jgi:alkanesulfonate monooxygenase SsuD/methylene tetrahydromethanopterin reductase-like flavin-dependent oxidoreductase (luciferase family)
MATRDSLTPHPIHRRPDSGGLTDLPAEVDARIDRIPTGRFTDDSHPSWAPGSTSVSASVVDFPAEFEARGVPTAGRATDAALELMTRLWRDDSIGPFKSSEGEELLTLHPLPPGRAIPLWVGGRSSAAIDRAVRIGDWWMPYVYSFGRFERDRATLVARSGETGRECAKAAVHALALLGDTKQQALATATRMLSTVYGQSFDEATAEGLCIVGTSLECAEQTHCFVAAAAEAVCFNVLADPDGCDGRVEQFCADVLPELRR